MALDGKARTRPHNLVLGPRSISVTGSSGAQYIQVWPERDYDESVFQRLQELGKSVPDLPCVEDDDL